MSFKSCKIIFMAITSISVLFFNSFAISADKVVVIPLGASKEVVTNSYFEQTRVVENLEDWNTNYSGSDATYTQTGTTSTVSLSGNVTGDADISFVKNFPDAKGMIGTMNLTNINKGAGAGFGMYIGMLGDNHIHTNINFSEWDGNIRIRYKLRLRDSGNNNVETLAWGYIPANTLVGQDVKIGFVKIENAAHFYINGNLLFKWQPTEIIAPREWTSVWYWEWVDQDVSSSVSATFKDISIIK